MGIEPPPCSCADDEDDLRALREARAEGTDRVSRKPKNAPAGVLIVYCSLSCVTRSLFLCSRTMFKSSSERLPSVSIPRRCSSFLASATSWSIFRLGVSIDSVCAYLPLISSVVAPHQAVPQCAVRRELGVGLEVLGVAASFAGLPIRLRTASPTLARPFACILSFSASMMLTTSMPCPLFEVPPDAKSHGAVVPFGQWFLEGQSKKHWSTGTKCLLVKLTSLESGSEN